MFSSFFIELKQTMNRKTIAAIAITAATALSGMAKKEVVMTVNGEDVSRSEFEYLYHKNQQQQVDPQTLEEYAEMFKIYKLKVADAHAKGIDTLASFRKEMDQYKADLAKPYMTDSIFLNSLVKEEFDRSRNEVEAFHIMILKGNTPEAERLAYATADSLRTAIIGGDDFGSIAKQYSVDRGSYLTGGRMGWITAGRFPYAFEKAAFSLEPGEISEIVESAQAYHVLKGGRKRPARGSVLAEHIMKMCRQDATAEEEASAKASIDSIYNVVKANPEKFEDLARELSDDKGSGRQGGRLQWFEAGMMVEPFDSAAFEIGVGEISEPFRSQFGWHIVRKLDKHDPATLEEMKPGLLQRFANDQDERNALIRKNLIANLRKKHKGVLSKANLDMLCNGVVETGIDSVWMANARNRATIGNIEIAKIGKNSIRLADWAETAMPLNITDGETASRRLRSILENFYDNRLISAEEDWLYANVPAYSNLLDEYRDGSLLYEASLREVWDRAGKDTEGLENYFNTHRSNYTWQKPHVKGILVQAVNDSVGALIRERLASISDEAELKALGKDFAGKASLKRVNCEEGHDKMVDYLAFGGAEVSPSNKKFTVTYLWNPRMLNEPESMSDVKSLVVSDFQNQLEADWVKRLKEQYPVTVNEKALRKVK